MSALPFQHNNSFSGTKNSLNLTPNLDGAQVEGIGAQKMPVAE